MQGWNVLRRVTMNTGEVQWQATLEVYQRKGLQTMDKICQTIL